MIMFSLWYEVAVEVEHYQYTRHVPGGNAPETTFSKFLNGLFKNTHEASEDTATASYYKLNIIICLSRNISQKPKGHIFDVRQSR